MGKAFSFRRSGAFTLIELLVVIAIIAILAAILFPVFAQARVAAKKTATLNNVKQLGTGVNMYITDFDDMYPELVQGGCEGRAGVVNRLWSRALYPYVKNQGVFRDEMAEVKAAGFRFDASIPAPELGLIANPPPCNNSATDRRAQSIGMNRNFLSYWNCDPANQIGCKSPGWEAATPAACSAYYTNQTAIEQTSSFVVFATTATMCNAGQGYIAGTVDAVNAPGGLTSRNGEGSMLAFADSHAKFYKTLDDPAVATAWGNTAAKLSVTSNRGAVIRRATQSNRVNGILNCVNHNPAGVVWSRWTSVPGENASLDALCNSAP